MHFSITHYIPTVTMETLLTRNGVTSAFRLATCLYLLPYCNLPNKYLSLTHITNLNVVLFSHVTPTDNIVIPVTPSVSCVVTTSSSPFTLVQYCIALHDKYSCIEINMYSTACCERIHETFELHCQQLCLPCRMQ
jgi:hypothetical protein